MVLSVLDRLFYWREVKNFVIRAHGIIGSTIVAVNHHFKLGKFLLMNLFLVNFVFLFAADMLMVGVLALLLLRRHLYI